MRDRESVKAIAKPIPELLARVAEQLGYGDLGLGSVPSEVTDLLIDAAVDAVRAPHEWYVDLRERRARSELAVLDSGTAFRDQLSRLEDRIGAAADLDEVSRLETATYDALKSRFQHHRFSSGERVDYLQHRREVHRCWTDAGVRGARARAAVSERIRSTIEHSAGARRAHLLTQGASQQSRFPSTKAFATGLRDRDTSPPNVPDRPRAERPPTVGEARERSGFDGTSIDDSVPPPIAQGELDAAASPGRVPAPESHVQPPEVAPAGAIENSVPPPATEHEPSSGVPAPEVGLVDRDPTAGSAAAIGTVPPHPHAPQSPSDPGVGDE